MPWTLTIALMAQVAAAEMPVLPTAQAKEKLICRREVPIGSLIASRKVCLSKQQWNLRGANGNEEARKMAFEGMSRPNCNDSGC
jgi:hypothetical protein